MTTPRAITPTELAYLARDNQWSAFFLSIDAPPSVYTARVNGTPGSTDKVAAINYTSGSGTLGDVVPGMTLAIGTRAGAYDKGLARIRAYPTGAVFYVGETSEINWVDGDYLTVLDEFGLWPKHIHMGSDKITPYVDYNIAYSNQHTYFAPVIVGGPNPVVWLTEATVNVAFDASSSWVLGGSAITFAWVATGASGTSGTTSATPTFTYNATGRYRVSCTATANGKTTTRFWTVQVYGADRLPVTQFVPSQVSGGDDGYGFSVTMYAEAGLSTVRDRALVTLFARDHYGDTEISLGQIPGRENIVAWGWIEGESIEYSAELSTVTFEVKPVGYWMQQMPGFPAGLENVAGAANSWMNFNRLTLDKAMYTALYYRSTAPACIDWVLTGDTKLASEFPSPGSTSLWEQINTFSFQALMAKPIVNRLGQLYVMVDANLTPPASRSAIPTVMTLTPQDWSGKLSITRNPTNRCSLVDLSGTYYNGATITALFSLSYGNVYGRHGATQRMDRLVLGSQAQANELAGLVMGQQNNNYPTISAQLAANNRMLDTAPRQFVSFSLAAGDTPRDVALTNIHLIPRRISYTIDMQGGVLWPQVEFETETFPAHAITGLNPATVPDPPPSDSPPVENPGGDTPEGSVPSDLVYVMLGAGLYRSRDFSASSPTWAQVGVDLMDSESELILDPFTPKNIAYVSGAYGIWRSTDLDSYANFANVLTNTDFAAANTGFALETVQDIRATITASGRLYCLAIGKNLSDEYYAFAGRSSDNGATWAWTALGVTTNATDLHGLACSQVNADTVYASAGPGTLYKSTNGGVSFSSTSPVGAQTKPIANIDVPYVAGDDSLVLIGGPGSTVASAFTQYYLDHKPPSDWRGDFGVYIKTVSLPSAAYAMWDHPSLPASGTITVVWSITDGVAYPGWAGRIWLDVDHAHNYSNISGRSPEFSALDCDGSIRTTTWAFADASVATDVTIGCIQISAFTATIYSISIDGVTLYSASADDYIQKSTDSGASFGGITPASGGAVGWRGLHSDATDSNHLTALVGSDPASLDLVVTTDGGGTWDIRQTGLSSPVALGRWPYGSNQGFLLDASKVYWTANDFADLVDKTGDLSVSDPRMIVPMWVS